MKGKNDIQSKLEIKQTQKNRSSKKSNKNKGKSQESITKQTLKANKFGNPIAELIAELIPNKLFLTQLSETKNTELNQLLMDHCYKNIREIKKNKLYKHYLKSSETGFSELAMQAYELLNKVGLRSSEEVVRIELYSYNMDGGKINSIFSIHKDNDADGTKVNTCLFYTHRDDTIIDCDLDYYVRDKNQSGFRKYILPKNIKNTHKVKTGNVLLMSGTLSHSPQNCKGVGLRNVIVVMLRALNNQN